MGIRTTLSGEALVEQLVVLHRRMFGVGPDAYGVQDLLEDGRDRFIAEALASYDRIMQALPPLAATVVERPTEAQLGTVYDRLVAEVSVH